MISSSTLKIKVPGLPTFVILARLGPKPMHVDLGSVNERIPSPALNPILAVLLPHWIYPYINRTYVRLPPLAKTAWKVFTYKKYASYSIIIIIDLHPLRTGTPTFRHACSEIIMGLLIQDLLAKL